MSTELNDVVVVGAGPAGATCAGLLARAGLRVTMIDRDRFPRFHIGESLLPACRAALDELGVDVDTLGQVRKRGATFLDEHTGERGEFPFFEAFPSPYRYAWNVERATLDHALERRAIELGAQRAYAHVERVAFESDHVRVELRDSVPIEARFVIDATGQSALLARQHRALERIPGLGRVAVFGHYDDVGAAWDELVETGDIRVLRAASGWAWVIPLANRRVSAGLVSSERVTAAQFEDYVSASPLLSAIAVGARRTPLQTIADYSFENRRSYGARFVSIGDSATFLDPVFSSGVTLAVLGAQWAAERLTEAFGAGEEAHAELFEPWMQRMKHGTTTFHALIDRFYHSNVFSNLFLGERAEGSGFHGLVSVLAGDVWSPDNAVAAGLRSARIRGARAPMSAH